jgi:uncharacterized protein (DUF433 family)
MDRIVTDPAVCSGKPVIKGTRIMVRNVLGLLKAGYTFGQIRESYPAINDDDIRAAIDYARELVDDVVLIQRAS